MASLKQRRQVRNSAYPNLGSHEGSIWVRCPYEWHVKAKQYAKIRHDRDVSTGDEWRMGMKTNPHYDGLMGEYVIGHLLDLPVDEDNTRRDFKRDFVTRFGLLYQGDSLLNVGFLYTIDSLCDFWVSFF